MGGSAFTSLGYATPRMPDEVYRQLRIQCKDILESRFFAVVDAPAAPPEKATHGDLDLLALPHDTLASFTGSPEEKLKELMKTADWDEVAKSLGASAWIMNRPTVMFTVPLTSEWAEKIKPALVNPPKDQVKKQVSVSNKRDQIGVSVVSPKCPYKIFHEADSNRLYAQVDVHLAESREQFDWLSFTHGHGDKLMILNILSRPLGLVVKDDGLWVRLKEIQDAGETKKGCHVLITKDIRRVVNFWGLHGSRENSESGATENDGIETAFQNEDDLFRYLISSPLFGPAVYNALVADDYALAPATKESKAASEPAAGTINTIVIRSKDRKHVRKRAMFARFIENYLPDNADVLMTRPDHDREDVLAKLLVEFEDNGIVERVEAARDAFQQRRNVFGTGKKNKKRRQSLVKSVSE